MSKHPYSDLPKSAFWKTGVAQQNLDINDNIYKKKFNILPKAKIVTAGSCFAQHITQNLKTNGFYVFDVEPPPPGLPESLHGKYGYSTYSARYGNIYTVRQLLQLAMEVNGDFAPQNLVWEKNNRYYDSLRPSIETEGFDSVDEVLANRKSHLSRVKELFLKMDVFIFTLGLTEMWIHKSSGTVYPTAPGVLAGEFDEKIYGFKNSSYDEILSDFRQFRRLTKKMRGGKNFKIILTVSPVPLTATASGDHVLLSNTRSKAILRSVASELSMSRSIDYFPSYEIVTNPSTMSHAYSENLRNVRPEMVDLVMHHFFDQHQPTDANSNLLKSNKLSSKNKSISKLSSNKSIEEIYCEEALLEAFGE